MPSDSTDKPKSVAPGQYLGYSLQQTRFLMRLLDADPDWTVSLEAFEDVGIETPEGNKVAEQDKSTLSHNPISDRAIDLWKTFANWISAVESASLDPYKTTFEIYLSKPKKGKIAESFHDAKDMESAELALEDAKNQIWGEAPKRELRSSVSVSIAKYVDKVFESDSRLVSIIIKNFNLKFSDESPLDDLRATIRKAIGIPEEQKEDFTLFALGWVKDKIDTLIENGKAAAIQGSIFQNAAVSYLRGRDNRTILETYACKPTKAEIERDLRLSTYVRQLEIIDIEIEGRIRAVTDKLRASVHRSRWSEKGIVLEDSFNDFEDDLIRSWDNLNRKIRIKLSSGTDVEKGQYLYAECSLLKHKIAGVEVPPCFTPGSYHALSDVKVVGWHPQFDKLLDDDEVQDA